MKDYIEERALKIAKYILDNKATVRQTAEIFRLSKSTVHKDVSDRLKEINKSLADDVHNVMMINKVVGQRLGGINTWKKKREEKQLREMNKKAV